MNSPKTPICACTGAVALCESCLQSMAATTQLIVQVSPAGTVESAA